jgi:hypothetical protein
LERRNGSSRPTLYLLPGMNEKLRPKILKLKPGTRVVAHDYDFVSMASRRKEKNTGSGKNQRVSGAEPALLLDGTRSNRW